ncbi:uncharacterized protein (TIGR02646 family) [Arcicella aurantiaca]|uniref:Uncharacterized protein (TIGR02646 family) n=1 Tax=Arcicella aurantiaca TaxID=591202 RepID=A0A316EJY4_9BACT|nr:retron system putative HNH endonuclease [Arcicella aurantiaca]PWK29202.1 uncharacterized protein (TIGR02646 family) [Arcicella aurantiaca]
MYKIPNIKRTESEPQILKDKGKEWTDDFIAKRKVNPKYKHSWIKNRVNYHDKISQSLGKITDFHCSYCDEYPLDERAKIDNQIDHFKPISKTEFIHLAYEWTNLYLSCGGCNKSKLAQYSDLILRPDADNYIASDYFFFDPITGIIEINETKGKEYVERAITTIDVFNLNHPSIVKKRKKAIKNFLSEKSNSGTQLNINDYDYRNFIEQLL